MRIKDKYEKLGYFWLPGHDDSKVPGTLKIMDGGHIELEIVGHFEEKSEVLDREIDFDRIIGEVEQDGLVTLENCFYLKKSYPFGTITRSQLCVNQALIGAGYEKDEIIKLNSVSFTVEGVSEWIGISGLDIPQRDSYRNLTVNYKLPEEIVCDLIDGFELKIWQNSSSEVSRFEAKIAQQAYLTIQSEETRELSEYLSLISKITFFLCFAIDSNVTISDVSATTNDLIRELSDGKKLPIPIKLYYASIPFSKDIPKKYSYRMLFGFGNIQKNAEEIFKTWLEAYSRIRPALDLYFSSVTGEHKYLESRFLALAQSLETYHRRTSTDDTRMEVCEYRRIVDILSSTVPEAHIDWLKGLLRYGNEINLGQRIKKIVKPYKTYLGTSRERNRLIRRIVDTRNYLTHYNEELKGKIAGGKELYALCLKMEAIFQLHLLQQIGFSEAEIEVILTNNYKLKQKLSDAS